MHHRTSSNSKSSSKDRSTDGRSMDELNSRTLPGFGGRVREPQVSANKELLGDEVD
jgi:hypothetical protein